MRTIRELDQAGMDLMVRCRGCAREDRVDAIVWWRFEEKGWDDALEAALTRFRCRTCGDRAVAIEPVPRPPAPANAAEQLVAGIFHRNRSSTKKARRDQPSCSAGTPTRYNQWWRWQEGD